MKPTMEILARISNNSRKNKEEVFTRLYRYLLRPDIYFEAYKNLYANNGAGTKGIDSDTVDGFSEAKIEKIIKSLKNENYQPKPVRRTYIPKKNDVTKKRPLGLPTFTEKLVQEVLRLVLEAVYEPIFLNCSHGFRSKKSCHTALQGLKSEFNGARWFIEGDIKGCFDNIDHSVLVGLVNRKIKDAQIIKLIYKFLKAGYIENWQYHKTHSGTPQGGIISPLLANIYLHELDKFVMQLKSEFDIPGTKKVTPEYQKCLSEMSRIQYHIKRTEGEKRQQHINEYQKVRAKMLKTPCKSQTDKKIMYVRYADDFLIGVNGNREECEYIKSRLSELIGGTLKMELSDEKTLITHSSQYARFLGYDVRVRRDDTIKHGGAGNKTQRTLNNMIELSIPFSDKIHNFIFSKGIAKQTKDGTLFPIHRAILTSLSDLEIVSAYNAELRGICNYYSLASNFNNLGYFSYLMEYSCLKTLANKHKTTISKVIKMFKNGSGKWGIPYETKAGKKRCYFAKHADCKKPKEVSDATIYHTLHLTASNSLENRLRAKVCELCGNADSERYELHHVNKLKNLTGKTAWERAMIARRRKTLAVCIECHDKIHQK